MRTPPSPPARAPPRASPTRSSGTSPCPPGGQPRATNDIDVLLVFPGAEALSALATRMREQGLSVSEDDLRDALRDGSHVSVFDGQTSFHVEVKPARDEDERAQVRDAVDVPFHGASLRVTRPEETVAYKLRFGSEQDLKDARSILVRRRGRLDLTRLRGLARHLGVEDALERALHEGGA